MLEVEALDVYYGHVQALHGVSFRVEAGEIVTLIGANGAGKTTCLRVISGLLRPRAGSVRFQGESLEREAVEAIVRRGIAHCPEGRRVFPGLSVDENLEMGAAAWRSRGASIAVDLAGVYRLFPRLAERRKQLAWSLSGGEQQMLAVGRALMSRPKLLLLDEPSLGLAPIMVEQLFEKIGEINRQGMTILLVEQNAAMALSVAHRGYVLETGRITQADSTDRLRGNPQVQAAYLGG
jgi:branched-chain amino acid transport system ATP-binding protein